MATIYNHHSQEGIAGRLREADRAQLLAQEIVVQGAINAVGFLLKHGCNEVNATQMLADLRAQSGLIESEYKRRGLAGIFDADQTGFF